MKSTLGSSAFSGSVGNTLLQPAFTGVSDERYRVRLAKEGCKKGLVQEAASKPGETGGGQTPEQPEKAKP